MADSGIEEAAPIHPRPPVVGWFKAYAWFMTVVYLLCAIGGTALLIVELPPRPDVDSMEIKINAIVFLVIGAPLMIAFAVAAMLPPSKGAWIYNLVMICLTMTSCLCLPVAIPLLIFWLKADTKAYFGTT